MDKAITIPKELADKDDLVVIPRRDYEEFLRYLKRIKDHDERLWRETSKKKLLDSYDQADAIYDKI